MTLGLLKGAASALAQNHPDHWLVGSELIARNDVVPGHLRERARRLRARLIRQRASVGRPLAPGERLRLMLRANELSVELEREIAVRAIGPNGEGAC